MNGLKAGWLGIAVLGLMAVCASASYGADGWSDVWSSPSATDSAHGAAWESGSNCHLGLYTAADGVPDCMYSNVCGRVVDATAAPSQPTDYGAVIWTNSGSPGWGWGPVAIFDGRSTGWGCYYRRYPRQRRYGDRKIRGSSCLSIIQN